MLLYKKGKSTFFLLWAVSVFLLCTGSLINFHQNKIWGKPLNFQIVAVKREASKIIKINSDDTGSVDYVPEPGFMSQTVVPVPENGIRILVYSGPVYIPASGIALTAGLRAPPAII